MYEPKNPDEVLVELRKRSEDLFHLALVCKAARTLAEWSDAQDSMAQIMEGVGDLLDQVDQVHLGFYRRTTTPTKDLVARGQRLESELHHFCGPEMQSHDGCNCSDCESIRAFSLVDVE